MKVISIILFLGMFLFSSCVKEDFPSLGRNYPEGKTALLTLKLKPATMDNGGTTRAVADALENKVENLRVLIFDDQAGELVTNMKDSGPFTNTGTGVSLTIKTYSGNNYTMCLVANVFDPKIEAALDAVKTYDDLNLLEAVATDLSLGIDDKKPLMMTAIVPNLSIAPGASVIADPVKLDFIVSKVTMVVKNNTNKPNSLPPGEELIILGWTVEDARSGSYIFPQPNYNPSIQDPALWLTTTNFEPFEQKNTSPAASKEEATHRFYFFENLRGGREFNGAMDPPMYPGMDMNDQNPLGKGWYKPFRATAIIIRLMHRTPGLNKEIKAFVYLGENNHSDYNVRRGHHYTINVEVNGLDDIETYWNYEYSKSDFAVDVESPTLDAHADCRGVALYGASTSSGPTLGKVTVEILDSQDRPHTDPAFDADWLKISPLNLMYHQVKQTSGDAVKWQQNASPTSGFVRGRYIPHTKTRRQLPLEKHWWNNEGISVQDDDDNVMEFSAATHRMCYKITNFPFAAENYLSDKATFFYVYAEEYFTPKGNPRAAKVRISYYKDGANPDFPQEQTIVFTQDGYTPIFKDFPGSGMDVLDMSGMRTGVKKKFVVENVEEYNMRVDPHVSMKTNIIYEGMKWGYNDQLYYSGRDSHRNGKYLTAYMVYKDVQRSAAHEPIGFGKGSDSYRPIYSHSGWVLSQFTGSTTGAPYHYPYVHNLANVHHPIHRTTALRYCHEKNRDVNGDGVIDETEAHWYTPAQQQLRFLWIVGMVGGDGLKEDRTYWSAREAGSMNAWGMDISLGADISLGKSYLSTGDNRKGVRCIRDL